ncbi:MAG: DUF1460 domain-containing protein, partial [Prevotella sp.]|nr:DUF1460 domain-containing protein [Prevotella sp.]
IQYLPEDSLQVINILEDANERQEDVNLILYIARKMLNVSYVAHTLDGNKTEKLVINLRELDCTTFVENVLALYLCIKQNSRTFETFCDNLCDIRYRDGSQPHYLTRLHYFTDWIDNNTAKGLCFEIQSPSPPFSEHQTINVNFMSSHPDNYKMLRENPDYLPYIKDMEKTLNGKTYKYIPKSEINKSTLLKDVINDGDIIATTTCIGGLDIQHLGFAVWHSDGLHLLNASSLHHKVIEDPLTLYQYLQNQKTMTGIRVVRVSSH